MVNSLAEFQGALAKVAQPALSSVKEYRYGVFALDVRSGELRKHGIRIKLQELPAQALLALIERQGELVSRQELRARLWPEGTFVDFEHSISSAINKVRAALNDSAKHPRYIETVGRQGYRFIYPVQPVYAAATSAASAAVAPPSTWAQRWKVGIGITLAAALVVAFAVGVFTYWRRTNEHSSVRSVAVLPLKNLSSDPEQEFFSEGLTDELIARLASLNGLRVISRTSSMQYKNSKKPLPQIAKELNVDAIVEGSVLRSGGRVRITAELIHATDDHHIWAESYERDQRDIFDVQNEVTNAIARSIQLKIAPETKEKLAAAHPMDPQAHDDYLRGKHYWSKRTPADFTNAIDYFQRAITRDPNYAAAYAGLANTYALVGGYSLIAQGPFIEKARAAATRALEIDPKLADAHVALAVIAQNYDWDWRKAESEYKRAIELDPNNATAHHWYAEYLAFQARFGEAFPEIGRAEQLDPLSLIIQADKAAIYFYARQYERSIEQFESVLAKDAMFGRAHLVEVVYVENGQFNEALRDAELVRKTSDSISAKSMLGYVLARKGDLSRARAILQELKKQDDPQTDPIAVLMLEIGLNDKDAAFETFERAYQLHSNALTSLKVNPMYDGLRSDPRFQDLMKRVGLAQ